MGQYQEDVQSLYGRLEAYGKSDFYPCHMPGHKRNLHAGEMAGFYRIDITEIDGFDDLHHADGVILKAQQRANALYGADETYYLVNGSTCGVLASVLSVAARGDEILIARNCHKSVYHAAIMQELVLRYYCPDLIREFDIYDGVDAEKLGRLLDEYPSCRAAVITSPTYEGIISDVRAIADAVHERDKILIVDEAHGAHLGLSDGCTPQGAVAAGADLVIHSLHKTLPSMTQTALLHVNGNRVDRARLRNYLSMLQSSSPSYVLMASMDSCVRYVEKQGSRLFSFLQKQYGEFCQKISGCRYIHVGKATDVSGKGYAFKDWDIGKLVISVKGSLMTGQQLYDILRDEYHLQMEMAAGSYALAMMTVMDTEEGWQRLADALVQIDGRIEEESIKMAEKGAEDDKSAYTDGSAGLYVKAAARVPRAAMGIAEAFHQRSETVKLSEASGRIAAGFIGLYPPGIPLLVPGEVIGGELIESLQASIRMGLCVRGLTEDGKVTVAV